MILESQSLTLEFAFLIGALHALEPGHGKTAMVAYMLGPRRNILHASLIGMGSALSHSLSIFVIAAITHLTNHLLTNTHETGSPLTAPLEWLSGGLILVIGLYLFIQVLRDQDDHSHCGHEHSHEHSSTSIKFQPFLSWLKQNFLVFKESRLSFMLGRFHSLSRTRASTEQKSKINDYKIAALLGFGGGLIPCPSALAAYLSSIASGDTSRAFLTMALFSVGTATTIACIGILLSQAGPHLLEFHSNTKRLKFLAYARALLILGVGAFHLVNLTLR